MSEENNEAPIVNNEPAADNAPIQNDGASMADLKALAADGFDSELKSTAENPEADEDWTAGAIEKFNKKDDDNEEGAKEDEEEDTSEADSEQSDESSEDKEESESEDDKDDKKEEDDSETPSSELEVKVNGEILKLSLDEIRENHPEVLENLKNGLSGAKETAKRFSELDAEKKSFYAEKTEIEGYVKQFEESTKDGNILGGLTFFAEFANIPPYLLKEQLIASLRPEIEKRTQMSPDQINNMRLRDENEYLAKKNESDTQKWKDEQAQAEANKAAQDLQNQINSIRETHNISDEEWAEAYEALDKSLPPEVEVIPLKAIEEHITSQRAEVATEQRLQTLVSPVSEKVNDKFVSELRSLMNSHPELTNDDLNRVIADSLKIQAEKELKKNLKKKSLEPAKKVVKNDANRSFKDLQDLIEWD